MHAYKASLLPNLAGILNDSNHVAINACVRRDMCESHAWGHVQEGRAAVHENGSQGGIDESIDAKDNLVYSMHGAIRRAMRLSMHSAWNLQLAADPSAREQLIEVGQPIPCM